MSKRINTSLIEIGTAPNKKPDINRLLPNSKVIKKSTFTRQVVLNLILDGNYILTGSAVKKITKFGILHFVVYTFSIFTDAGNKLLAVSY